VRPCLPLTALGMGAMFFLVDPDAELCITTASRAMNDAEWAQYTRSHQALRKRRPMSLKERAAAETNEGRMSDETMRDLAKSGEMRVTL
jgi:hypothetical protein